MGSDNIIIKNFYYIRGLFRGAALQRKDSVKGSGTQKTENRPSGRFSSVKTLIPGDVIIRYGDEDGIVVEADENIVPLITTDIIGDDLMIFASGAFSTQQPLKVSVTLPTDREMPDLDLVGSGDIAMHGIDQAELTVALQGSGDIVVSGKARHVSLTLKGSGDIDARRLKAEEADITLMGSGDIEASASEKVSVSLMGSGDVVVVGSPKKVNSSKLGSGDVSIR